MIDEKKSDNKLIQSAWHLYIEKGILKRRVLRDDIAYSWERVKLLGAKYDQQIDELLKGDVKTDCAKFTDGMKQDMSAQSITGILCSMDAIIVDSYIVHDVLSAFKVNRKFNRKMTGNLSLYQTLKTNVPSYCYGSEHYLECLHELADYSTHVHINHQSYLLLLFTTIDKKSAVNSLQPLEKLKSKWLTEWNLSLDSSEQQPINNCSILDFNQIDLFCPDNKRKKNEDAFKSVRTLLVGDDTKRINKKIKDVHHILGGDCSIVTVDFEYTDYKHGKHQLLWQDVLNNTLIVFKNVEQLSKTAQNRFYDGLSYIEENECKGVSVLLVMNKLSYNAVPQEQLKTFSDVLMLDNDNMSKKNIDKETHISIVDEEIFDLGDIEKLVIIKALEKTNKHISATAKLLNIGRSTLYRKMEKYKININE